MAIGAGRGRLKQYTGYPNAAVFKSRRWFLSWESTVTKELGIVGRIPTHQFVVVKRPQDKNSPEGQTTTTNQTLDF